jgi:hypothetical protein
MARADPVAPLPSTLLKMFIGKDGLRVGWGLLIFIALFAAVAICVNVLASLIIFITLPRGHYGDMPERST